MRSIILSGFLLLLAVCAAKDIPLHAETVSDFETVFPEVIQGSRHVRSADTEETDKEMIVRIKKENENLTLHLLLNDKLAPNFTSISYDEDGNEIITTGKANCYYQGKVEEHPKWVVVMNTCGGLKGFFGDMNNKSEYFRLAPVSKSATTLDEAHKLIAETQTEEDSGTCGTEDHSDSDTIADNLESLASDIERVRRQSPTGDYIVEMAIVNDNRQYNYHGRNLSATVQNALDVVNAADLLYRPLRVRVVVVHVITWTSGDRISIVADPQTLLDRIRSFKRSVSQPHDAMMLITGQDLSGSTVGIAYLNTMCGSASVGVVQDARRSTSSTASTFAHELGHVLNLQHDTNGCSCSDRSGRCVMAGISGFPAPELWSSCSTSQLRSSLTRASNNLGRCLENEPLTTIGDPVCGNGIREGDEVCDCGSPQECDDPCCNPRTCRPRDGAQCTKGECCSSTCQYKAYGTRCRSTSGQCDIEEYCSGESSECPVDVYRQDGTACNSNQVYCFSGVCQTYDDQCQYHFGTDMGVSQCYTSYNPQGSVFGNCGHTTTDYTPCSQGDAMCGQLFCDPGNYQQRVSGVRVTIVTVGVFVNGQRRDCQGFTTQPGTDMLSPGLVKDGTKCRDGHLCYNQRCTQVSAIPGIRACPQANGRVCSGRGVCNNRGQCSCNVGFIGSACQTSSGGPSVNECENGQHNCDQGCVDTEESFFCTCNSGFTLASDGRTCNIDCGGRLTTASGSFSSPGYPNSYPAEGVECEWTIEIPNTRGTIEFTIDDSVFGINGNPNGNPPCATDHIEFFDGTSSNAASLEKICGLTTFYPQGLQPIATSSSRAKVVFTGSNLARPESRVGVRVTYRTVSSQQNECQVNNGGCAHICRDTAQSFECSCRAGYILGSDRRSCTDVNECSSNNGGCEHNCQNTQGSFRCTCNSGFTLNSDQRRCTDINECTRGTDNCAQRCTNTPGSFTCSCNAGYRLASNRLSCNDINECSEGSDNCAQRCTNTIGSFTCSCNAGYTLSSDRRTCNDINECTAGSHNCEQRCTNTAGSFTCSCNSGFTLAADGRSCIEDSTEPLCGGRLTATSGSFQTPGWPTSYPNDNFQCEWIIDIPDNRASIEFRIDTSAFGINGRSPCATDNIEFFEGTGNGANSLEKICGLMSFNGFTDLITTTGSEARVVFTGTTNFRSASRVGVKVDYRTISAPTTPSTSAPTTPSVNECLQNNGGCEHNCQNTQGSFTCTCNSGFTLNSDQRRCTDIDECTRGTDNCAQRCTNTPGSFTCSCNAGYRLASNRLSCNDINECTRGTDNCAQRCTNTPGSFTCSCNAGYRLASNRVSCNDINECSEGSDNCAQRCTNTIGSFTCSCNAGYTLSSDRRTCNDINECTAGSHNCEQRCTNTAGSFTCSCNSGFTLAADGRSCIEDSTEPLCGGRLTATSGSFQTPGWPTSYPNDNFQCEWIIDIPDNRASIEFRIDTSAFGINGRSPCATDNIEFFEGTGNGANSLEKICGLMSFNGFTDLITTTGSEARVVFTGTTNFRSASRVGVKVDYRTISAPTTPSVNECLQNNGGCSQICTDTVDSFRCSCNSGYTLASDGSTCVDVNECATNNGGCQQNCFNFLGSFTCWCNRGYRLDRDRRTCNDVNECLEGLDNCDQVCVNTRGSYTCSCNNGFTLDANQRTCNEDTTQPPEGSCGGRLTASSGSLQSPGWPTAYPQNNFQCEWIIDLPDDNAVIEFRTDESAYGINGRPPCTRDFIEFFDGVDSSSRSLHKTCQYFVPPVIRTSSSRARVVFAGTVNRNRPPGRVGVRVTYQTLSSPRPAPAAPTDTTITTGNLCGGTLTEASGSFQTDGWPNSYRQENFQCEWIIRLPNSDATIQFTMDQTAFGINGHSPCTSDHIEFFDGTSSNANSLQKICGLQSFYSRQLPRVTTTSSTAKVVFTGTEKSSRPASRVGVRVTYRTVGN